MRLDEKKVSTYLSELASVQSTPGGGSGSALVAATGVALAVMVARIVLKRKVPTRVKQGLSKHVVALEKTRRALQRIMTKDARIYASVHAAYAYQGSPAVRQKKIAQALVRSYEVMMTLCADIYAARCCVPKIKKYATQSISNDLVLSVQYLDASFFGAQKTAQINIDCLQERKQKITLQKKLDSLVARYRVCCQKR